MSPEAYVRAEIKALLESVGAWVGATSQNRKSRLTPGFPDILAALPRGCGWLATEAKTTDGISSLEQQALETFCRLAGCPLVVGGKAEVHAYLQAVGLIGG